MSQNLFPICIWDFLIWYVQVFECKSWIILFRTKLLFRHFCPKLNRVLFSPTKSHCNFYIWHQNILRTCFRDETTDILFWEKYWSHWGRRHFHQKLKLSFFFFFWKISFLFVSWTSKYTKYKFWRKYYDILFQTKFLSDTSWWCFRQILTRIYFFTHKISFLFVSGTSKYGLYKF